MPDMVKRDDDGNVTGPPALVKVIASEQANARIYREGRTLTSHVESAAIAGFRAGVAAEARRAGIEAYGDAGYNRQ